MLDSVNSGNGYVEQRNNFSQHKIDHIINGSKGHEHNWELLVPDKNWEDIKSLIIETVQNGVTLPHKNVFKFSYVKSGQNIVVTYNTLSDGRILIGDAWIDVP